MPKKRRGRFRAVKIITYPDEILSQRAQPVQLEEIPALKGVFSEIAATLRYRGGLGLAAPQVGISKRFLAWIDALNEIRVMVNPVIVGSSGKIKIMEGCLSIPNIQKYVNRKRVVTVEFLNEAGYTERRRFKNLCAVIVQHEIDHLNGITILDNAKKRGKNAHHGGRGS